MPSLSGLPDEAVEAMAVAVCDWGGEDWNDLNEFGRDDCRDEARSVLAALPAGVYHSDGQGNVESYSEDVIGRALEVFNFRAARRGYMPHPQAVHSFMGLLARFAAPSATDTEKADA